MTKTILVTGGAGFIGSNFIRHILNKYPDYKITNLDKLTYCGNLESLKDLQDNPNYQFVRGDICDSKIVEEVVKGCDCIVNFAAESFVDKSIVNPSEFIHTNVYGTYVLLEVAKRHKLSLFCQISTDEVYGSIEKGSSLEDSPLSPNSPYAASKAAADLLVHSYFVTYNLPVIITRSSNNFGPYQYLEKVIPLFITNALEDKKLPLYGDGLNVRDWLFVLDNTEAIDLILHKGKIGEIYNIGAENEKTNLKLAQLILKKLNKSKDLVEFVKDRPGHDRRYSLNCDKIRNLGWQPRYNFEEALEVTINWYLSNQKWWKRLKGRF
jgi:dTDP-glucose 4,6-dehydratase